MFIENYGVIMDKELRGKLDGRFKLAMNCLNGTKSKKMAQKIYDNFEITNIFWDSNREEVEFIGKGFAITITDN